MGVKKIATEKILDDLKDALKNEIKESMEKDIVIKDLMLIIHYLETKLGIYKGLEDADESV
jgi:hypothetical protein